MVLEDTSHIMMFLRAGNGEIDRGGYIRPQVLDLKRAIWGAEPTLHRQSRIGCRPGRLRATRNQPWNGSLR